jgi:EmrB/QacA subfamily drug resistance transporter
VARRWWALVAIALGSFMTFLDNNIVNVALPTIERDVGLGISGLEWVVSGYILLFAGLLLVGGRLADIHGRRRIFFVGLAVFTVASLFAGLSDDAATLIASRMVQGVGAALLTPAALALIPATFKDSKERGLAVAIWSAAAALALALGPPIGGLISEYWHWGWIFLLNVPIGLVTLALGRAYLDESTRTRRRLDLPGLATSGLALFALVYALIEGDNKGWTSPVIIGAFAISTAAAAAFVVVEARAAQPMIDVALFRSRVFSGGVVAMGLWAFGVFGVYFFAALYLQNGLGFTPVQAGLAFVPLAVLTAVVATVAPALSARVGAHRAVAGGLAVMAVSVVGLATVGEGGTIVGLMPWMLAYGVGAGLLVPLTDVVVAVMPPERVGVASGVLNVSREVVGLLGIIVLGAIVSSRQSAGISAGRPPLVAFIDAYQFALVIAAVVIALGVPVAYYTLRGPLRQRAAEFAFGETAEGERLAVDEHTRGEEHPGPAGELLPVGGGQVDLGDV